MSEELDVTAALAYEAYRQSHMGTVAGGLPMPVFEQLSVPERDAWLAVAGAVTQPELPLGTRQAETARPPIGRQQTPAPPPPVRLTQDGLDQMTVAELRELAQAQGLSVPPSANKQALIDALLAPQSPRQEGHR